MALPSAGSSLRVYSMVNIVLFAGGAVAGGVFATTERQGLVWLPIGLVGAGGALAIYFAVFRRKRPATYVITSLYALAAIVCGVSGLQLIFGGLRPCLDLYIGIGLTAWWITGFVLSWRWLAQMNGPQPAPSESERPG